MSQMLYNVDMVGQQSSPVCWLACAAMVMQFKRRTTPSATQLEIRDADDFRQPGYTVPNLGSDGRWIAALMQMGFVVTRCSSLRDPGTLSMRTPGRTSSVEPSEDLIYRLLTGHGPFILFHHVGAFWYGRTRPNVPAGGEHAVVITGIDTGPHRVYFNNPWGDRDVPTTASSVIGAIRRYEAAYRLSIAYL
jgi:hypothetical protein